MSAHVADRSQPLTSFRPLKGRPLGLLTKGLQLSQADTGLDTEDNRSDIRDALCIPYLELT